MRELETIRAFLTGQGLFSALDLFFTFVFFAVLFAYSWKLTLIVLATIPVYLMIAGVTRPLLRERLNEKFNRGAESQQFLVEAIVGMQTIKASAVEPVAAAQWEERLAAYVRSAFHTTMLGAKGQNAIQYVNKLSGAALLLFGAKAVLDNEMTNCSSTRRGSTPGCGRCRASGPTHEPESRLRKTLCGRARTTRSERNENRDLPGDGSHRLHCDRAARRIPRHGRPGS